MKKFLTVSLLLLLAVCFVGCGSNNSAGPLDLTGSWTQVNKDSDSWQAAVIKDDIISINWVSDGGDTTSIYWIGTYEAPSEATDEYTWTSVRDESATDTALLASTDATKEFTYKDGQLSYKVSLLGTATTMYLEKEDSAY